MSIKTTFDIKKEIALAGIYDRLREATDKELEYVLEILVANDFYNFSIVEEFEPRTEFIGGFYDTPKIETIWDLPEKSYQYN